MSVIKPESAEELCELLRERAIDRRSISIEGEATKTRMGGPITNAHTVLATTHLSRVLEYEPRDLTISVEAGCSFASLQELLAKHGQMIGLDPPFHDRATIGGVIATNSSGPMRRTYGTARDIVIGMTFATLEGKLVKSGGMVVKNVAGLDMAKLMIGSFGTLAVITSVNFRVHSIPEHTWTFLFTFPQLEKAIEVRDHMLTSPLQPLSLDLLSPAAAVRLSQKGYVLALRAAGSPAVLKRYERELPGAERLTNDALFWRHIQEFSSEFLQRHPEGVILRISTPLSEVLNLLKLTSGPFICRVANGVTYIYFSSWTGAARMWKAVEQQGWPSVVDFAPDQIRQKETLWHLPGGTAEQAAFAMMKEIKNMFDPNSLLNKKRLYGRI